MRRPSLQRALAWTAAGTALGLVFASYFEPGLIVDLANQLWNCF